LDTIKIITYRTETALCNIIKKQMTSPGLKIEYWSIYAINSMKPKQHFQLPI